MKTQYALKTGWDVYQSHVAFRPLIPLHYTVISFCTSQNITMLKIKFKKKKSFQSLALLLRATFVVIPKK